MEPDTDDRAFAIMAVPRSRHAAPEPPSPADQLAPAEPLPTVEPLPPAGPQRSRARRLLTAQPTIAIAAVLVLAPAYIWYSSLLGMASNSDIATNVLQAWDLTHGHPLLQGWIQGNNSYLTNELLVWALVTKIIGITPVVGYVSQGFLYAVLVVLTALLAAGRTRDLRRSLLAVALVGAIMLAVNREVSSWMFLSLIDHLTTAIPLLILLLILDRAQPTWKLGLAAFAILTWALTADHLALFVGVAPVALVTAARIYFSAEQRKVHLAILGGALASVPASALFNAMLSALGGAAKALPPEVVFASAGEMQANFWETFDGLMIIFGAPLLGRSTEHSLSEVLHLGALGLAVAGWVLAVRALRHLSLVDQILIVAIGINIAAFLFSTMPGPDYTAHEMLIVVPFSAALAARLIAPRLTTWRGQLPVAAGFLAAVLLLAATLTGTRTPEPTANLTAWLRQQNLTYGLSGFWQAAAVSVESRGHVFVAPVINDSAGHVGPTDVGVRRDWYDKNLHDARFVIGWRGGDQTGSVHDLNDALLNQYFGPPKSIKRIDVYVVYVYDYNLLDRLLPADQLPLQYQYRGGG